MLQQWTTLTNFFMWCEAQFFQKSEFYKKEWFQKCMIDKKLNYTVCNKTRVWNEGKLSFQNGEEIISIMTYCTHLMNRPSY